MGTHDCQTRAVHRRQCCVNPVSALAAVLLAASAWPALAAPRSDEPAATGTIARQVAHEVRIGFAKPGREGIELSARLKDKGDLIRRPISWSVRNAQGEIVYRGDVASADFLTPPGDYAITARYGAVTVERELTVLAGQRLGVVFTLEVGGIRVLPRVTGLGLPAIGTRTTIYAASGPETGQQVAISTLPGEIFRLGAGVYRVETRFMPGNTIMAAQVTIKPGLMSAVEVDHVAGVARLSASHADSETSWTISDAKGEALPPIAGPFVEVVLKPGDYVAQVSRDGATSWLSFSVSAGMRHDVTLAP